MTIFKTRRSAFLTLLGVAVIVPTVFQFGAFFIQAQQADKQPSFHLSLRGFDPRDLIRGRFAVLQIDWKDHLNNASCQPANARKTLQRQVCGMCLKRDDAKVTATLVKPDDADTLCDLYIPRTYVYDHAIEIVHEGRVPPLRIYLDERHADAVDRTLREGEHKFSGDIIFDDNSVPSIRQFYIDDMPYEVFVKQNAK